MMLLEILSSKRVPGSVLNSLVTLFIRTKLYVMLTISMSMPNVRVNPKQRLVINHVKGVRSSYG